MDTGSGVGGGGIGGIGGVDNTLEPSGRRALSLRGETGTGVTLREREREKEKEKDKEKEKEEGGKKRNKFLAFPIIGKRAVNEAVSPPDSGPPSRGSRSPSPRSSAVSPSWTTTRTPSETVTLATSSTASSSSSSSPIINSILPPTSVSVPDDLTSQVEVSLKLVVPSSSSSSASASASTTASSSAPIPNSSSSISSSPPTITSTSPELDDLVVISLEEEQGPGVRLKFGQQRRVQIQVATRPPTTTPTTATSIPLGELNKRTANRKVFTTLDAQELSRVVFEARMIAQQNLREKKKMINDEDYFEEETAPVLVSQPSSPSPPPPPSTSSTTTNNSYLPFFDDDDEVGQAFIKSAQIPYVTIPSRSPTTSPRSPLPTSPGTSPRRLTLGAISAPPSMLSLTESGTGDVSKGWNKPSGFQRVTPKLTEKTRIALSKHRADDGSLVLTPPCDTSRDETQFTYVPLPPGLPFHHVRLPLHPENKGEGITEVEIFREEKGELCGFSTIDKSVLAFYHPSSSYSSEQNGGVLIVFSSTDTTEREGEGQDFRVISMKNLYGTLVVYKHKVRPSSELAIRTLVFGTSSKKKSTGTEQKGLQKENKKEEGLNSLSSKRLSRSDGALFAKWKQRDVDEEEAKAEELTIEG